MCCGSHKEKRSHEGGVGPEMRSPVGLMNPKKRRPFRGVGPEILSPAGLVERIIEAAGHTVKPTVSAGASECSV